MLKGVGFDGVDEGDLVANLVQLAVRIRIIEQDDGRSRQRGLRQGVF